MIYDIIQTTIAKQFLNAIYRQANGNNQQGNLCLQYLHASTGTSFTDQAATEISTLNIERSHGTKYYKGIDQCAVTSTSFQGNF